MKPESTKKKLTPKPPAKSKLQSFQARNGPKWPRSTAMAARKRMLVSSASCALPRVTGAGAAASSGRAGAPVPSAFMAAIISSRSVTRTAACHENPQGARHRSFRDADLLHFPARDVREPLAQPGAAHRHGEARRGGPL